MDPATYRIGVRPALARRMMAELRSACGDNEVPSAAPVDSRSLHPPPTCRTQGNDGSKKIKGVKLHVAVDKHGSRLGIEAPAANVDDRDGAMPMLQRLTDELAFVESLLDDNSYRGAA